MAAFASRCRRARADRRRLVYCHLTDCGTTLVDGVSACCTDCNCTTLVPPVLRPRAQNMPAAGTDDKRDGGVARVVAVLENRAHEAREALRGF